VPKNAVEECNTACMKMLQTETRSNKQGHKNAKKEAKSRCMKRRRRRRSSSIGGERRRRRSSIKVEGWKEVFTIIV
jgi:hypothetical protein